MSGSNEVDLPTLVAQEIAKQIPVERLYQDGLSAPTQETSKLLTDLIKTLRLVLAPIQYLSVLQDRYRVFIERSALRVPESQRDSPPSQILGPVLEAIRYEPENSISDEAFSQLLSRAFDREKAGQAHPAFPGLIRSLSDDELTLLRKISKRLIEVPYMRYAIANQAQWTHIYLRTLYHL